MELIYIELITENAENKIVQFKNFIEQRTDDLLKVEINQVESYDGQMGLGKFKNSVSATLDYLQNLPKLLKSILDYSFAFSSEIKLKLHPIEISIKYNSKPINSHDFVNFVKIINENIASNKNCIIVFGNNNIILQDINASTLNLNKQC